jgi:hypothetical protein
MTLIFASALKTEEAAPESLRKFTVALMTEQSARARRNRDRTTAS